MNVIPWLRTVMLAMAATLIATAAVQAAQSPSREGRHQPWEQRLQERLGLSEEQVQAIRQIREREADARKQHWQALQRAQAELRRAVLGNVDDATLQARQAEVGRLMAESLQRRIDTLKAITPVLTPQQREEYAKLMEGGRGSRGPHRPRQQS